MAKILFKNAQWRVTEDGLEAEGAEPYRIAKDKLTKDYHGGWPVFMSHHKWVDIDAFIEAWREALTLHEGAYSPPADPEKVAEMLGRVELEAALRKEKDRRDERAREALRNTPEGVNVEFEGYIYRREGDRVERVGWVEGWPSF